MDKGTGPGPRSSRAGRRPAHALLLLACALGCASTPPPPWHAPLHDGEAELATGHAERALALFESAHALAPEQPAVLRGLALASLALERPGESLAWFDELERVDDGAIDAELRRARCRAFGSAVAIRVDASDWAGAIALTASRAAADACRSDAAAAQALAASAVRAHRGAARAELDAGRRDEAVRHLEWVLEARPGDPDATLLRLPILLESGERDPALRLLSRALDNHPKDERLIEAMVRLLETP